MANTEAVLQQLSEILGPTGLLLGEDVAARSVDWLGRQPCEAKAIARPADAEQLAAVMAVCHAENQTVVTMGGLTGLVGGAVTCPDDIGVSLERLRNHIQINVIDRTLTVDAGVTLQAAQALADEHGLLLPVDLGARGSATIGGMLATNAGGNQVIRYGMMREQVLALDVVLADGTLVKGNTALIKNNAGYDLKHWFIGSEGTLGIITQATLRLRPKPASLQAAWLGLSGFDTIPGLLAFLDRRLPGGVSAFEVMWPDFYAEVLTQGRHSRSPLSSDVDFHVLVEWAGGNPETDPDYFNQVLADAHEQNLWCDASIAQSHADRDSFWAIRDDIESLSHAMAPLVAFDVSLPRYSPQ